MRAEDWEREQETLYVLRNSDLMQQIANSAATHALGTGITISEENYLQRLSKNPHFSACFYRYRFGVCAISSGCKESQVPTVLRRGSLRFYWYSHELGEPPHVHVDRAQRSAKIWLEPVRLARNFGFPSHEIRDICSIIENNRSELLEAWHEYFGA